jgi:hypothetical protein
LVVSNQDAHKSTFPEPPLKLQLKQYMIIFSS